MKREDCIYILTQKWAWQLTIIVFSISSSGHSRRWWPETTPALLINRSMLPTSLHTFSAVEYTLSRLLTSQTYVYTFGWNRDNSWTPSKDPVKRKEDRLRKNRVFHNFTRLKSLIPFIPRVWKWLMMYLTQNYKLKIKCTKLLTFYLLGLNWPTKKNSGVYFPGKIWD